MVKDGNKRLMITLTEKELVFLEDLSRKTGLSKSAIVKISLLEKMEKIQNILK